jgi:hypothetical protein
MVTNTAQSTLHRGLRLMKIAGIQITIDVSWLFIFLPVVLSLSAGYFPRQLPVSAALKQMLGEGVGRLVVMQDGTMRGLITKTGLWRFVEMKQLLAQ